MTARVVTDGGRIFVEADLSDFHAAGHFTAYRPMTPGMPVRMGHTNPEEAKRLAEYVNQRVANQVRLTGVRLP